MKRVAYVTNQNGVLVGHKQGGEAMYRTIQKAMSSDNKKLVLVGAGHVAKCMLFHMSTLNKQPKQVEIYNRDLSKAKKLMKDFKFITKVGTLNDLENTEGDILANVSHLGGREKDNLFTKEIVSKYKAIADVTFEVENTNLIKIAKKLKKKYATGWDMFTYQGQVVLEAILEQEIPFDTLSKHVRRGLSTVVK
jgi:shikimate 5-dehydrogenase